MEEVKAEGVKQITERVQAAVAASPLSVSIDSLYAWQKQVEKPPLTSQADADQAAELQRDQHIPRDSSNLGFTLY